MYRCSIIPKNLSYLLKNKEYLQKKGMVSEKRCVSNLCIYANLTMDEMERIADDIDVINDLRNKVVEEYDITKEELNDDFHPQAAIKFQTQLYIDELWKKKSNF